MEMRFGLIYSLGGKLKGWKGNERVGCMKAMIRRILYGAYLSFLLEILREE